MKKFSHRKHPFLFAVYKWMQNQVLLFHALNLEKCKEGFNRGFNHFFNQNGICLRRTCKKSIGYIQLESYLKNKKKVKKNGTNNNITI